MEILAAEPTAGTAGPIAGPADHVIAEPFDAFYRAHSDRVYRALALSLSNDDLAGRPPTRR